MRAKNSTFGARSCGAPTQASTNEAPAIFHNLIGIALVNSARNEPPGGNPYRGLGWREARFPLLSSIAKHDRNLSFPAARIHHITPPWAWRTAPASRANSTVSTPQEFASTPLQDSFYVAA